MTDDLKKNLESSRLKLASVIVVFHSTDAEIFLQLKKTLN